MGEVLFDPAREVAYPNSQICYFADLMVQSALDRIAIIEISTHRVLAILSRQELCKVRGIRTRWSHLMRLWSVRRARNMWRDTATTDEQKARQYVPGREFTLGSDLAILQS